MLRSNGVHGALPAETMAVTATMPHVLPGLGCGCGGCCSGGRGASSWGPVLVTSFLQRLLESRNKIRSRLR